MEAPLDLGKLAAAPEAAVLKALDTTRTGLVPAEVARRLREYGPNEFAGRKKLRPLLIFLSKFANWLLILLIVVALASGFLGSWVEAGIILFIVFGSALIDFINTYKSAKAAEDLQEKVNITAAIYRNGKLEERNMREVVPGDVVSLEAGDLVPADAILLEAKDLFLNESVLTGESMPAEKEIGTGAAKDALERKTVYLGTSVISGKGLAVAVVTGENTKVGNIAGKLKKADVPTEFEKNLKDFSMFIFRTTIGLMLAVIVVNIVLTRHNLLDTMLFAIAIAVGLTPELLPLIVTSNLAKGALKMSENGVIVKKLAAIHNFGSVDVLCTDKTGTLTEDRIVLMKCIDPQGKSEGKGSDETFYWGYLSSKHLTSLRGTLDRAIEDYKKLDVRGWEKLDEVPFDAERRLESVVVRKTASGSASTGPGARGDVMFLAKGAPEEILKRSKLAAAARKRVMAEYEKLSADGFRVLGLGVKKIAFRKTAYDKQDEKELEFVGFLAFLDPPKKTVRETLQRMTQANVAIKIITGDNLLVTKHIAGEIGLAVINPLTGDDLAKLSEHELHAAVEKTNIFARVNPEQKEAIIRTLRDNGHVVAYMGDGVNDVLSIKEADVGISVNNAVDIAKETADIILLRKGLGEIIEGIIEGRRTFANTFKYLMMALSSNFGNMFSMPIASIFLPFLPMTAPQILLNNFLYDSSQLAIPFDNVDEEFLQRPKKFDIKFMKTFMIIFGPLSSCFDFLTFVVLLWILHVTGAAFQTGWFLESIATQTFVVLIIRSRLQNTTISNALLSSTIIAVALGWILTFSPLGPYFGFTRFSPFGLALVILVVVAYLFTVELAKRAFYRKYGNLIEK